MKLFWMYSSILFLTSISKRRFSIKAVKTDGHPKLGDFLVIEHWQQIFDRGRQSGPAA